MGTQKAGRPRILLDARPLQTADAQRGIGTYVRGLVVGLLEAGLDRRVALLFDGGRPIPPVPAGRFVAHTVRRRYRGRLGLLEEAQRMPQDLRRLRPALYHATTLALPGRSPVPMVATAHDLIPWALSAQAMLGERTRWWLGRRLLKRADVVVTPSEATARDAARLARVPEDRLVVIPEGVSAGFAPAEGAERRVAERHGLRGPYLLFVGALDVRKDPRALLRAWRAARAEGAGVDLVLAGPAGSQAPGDLGGGVKLVGFVEHAALVDLYTAAACLVFPSRYEGFGLPLLEAMACGCPVVAYRNSSLPEVAGDAAILVDDGDAEALGRAAALLVRDEAAAARLRAAGHARAARYTWRRCANETAAVYERLLT